ncbi:MAG: type II toxin-antitoxin system VapC family toxin, partial [Deltaproteobacteria bacterium]|nr:type II toxin-antitoxin system VapC family toxin [Deltaproteobacteria bacterium]
DAAVDLAQAHGLSAYDATFLALARLEDCPLVTADERLAARAKRLGAH